MLVTLVGLIPEAVKAGVFEDAYSFYQTYGSEMAFRPGANNVGEIFYVTRGRKSVNTGIQYSTVGWKVTMTDSSGAVISTLYYELGGSYMTTVSTQIIGGYEYNLYKVTLENMRNRISASAQEALKRANCSIIFDACLTLKINGVMQGGMTDAGPSWGSVYTTYDGIASAVSWSAGAREDLRNYYNKSVEDIYYTVSLSKGTGVTEVYGAGRYCFGTMVTVSAAVDNRYVFSHWSGSGTSYSNGYSFPIYRDISLTANAKKQNLTITFYKDGQDVNSPKEVRSYNPDIVGQSLPNFGWTKPGYHQVGWSLYPTNDANLLPNTTSLSPNWMASYIPAVNMYAVWKENSYVLAYDGNGGQGQVTNQATSYLKNHNLPEEGFVREGYRICGWSTKKGATEPEFKKGERVSIESLTKKLGVEYKNGATIVLYAVWDHAPVITGEHIYVSLEDAKAGKVTEAWLSQYVTAIDREDGAISFGIRENNAFGIRNFLPEDFTSFQKEGSVSETFYALDSGENMVEKMVVVHIVDTSIYDAPLILGRVRFISEKYYKDAEGNLIEPLSGGLLEDSVWRKDADYGQLLKSIFYGD